MKTPKRLVLNVEEIRNISQYAHWIPITRGYHRDFLESNYPGWDWNDFLPVLDEAGVISNHKEGHECVRLRMGICMSPGIISVELEQGERAARVIGIARETEK